MDKIKKYFDEIRDKKILIQGLGLNGGGVGTALFFLENGIPVTITDLKTEKDLAKSIDELSKYNDLITYVLGEHRESDFVNADIVVKGPGVPPTNKFIQIAKQNNAQITSDIGIFSKIVPCPIFALTGSKGKSTTVSVIYSIFKAKSKNSFIGGNITISPLTFYKDLTEESLLILELSSWQLRDIKEEKFLFSGAGITNLLRDHQNYYQNMETYLVDKAIITQNQTKNEFLLLPYNDFHLNSKNINTNAQIYYFSKDDSKANFYYENGIAFYNDGKTKTKIFDSKIINVIGEHTKLNILIAAGFCFLGGIDLQSIEEGIKNFTGVSFRLELIREWNGIKFYNDTTATIPDAAVSAIKSFSTPIIWIAGGNDKNLDFSCVKEISGIPKKIFMLKGDGTNKMRQFLDRNDIIEGSSLEELLTLGIKESQKGDIILLSPGCTSFGLFQNEFHRGEVFNDFVRNLK
ncbi:MAG: UDP-N-acetylmuramoylalanine--D-glutamate ligase [Spirochaetes bacterium GWD1_27_9]|nr:MAG: UDP-N-acetylmuramoylalanine--D-glutamate ligase [Spirochaetes bacterium GWB1_27_13]OHD21453.1 MAG: UDP-N-acetylmuramoylalanine--D-glutamate ligase [Spirochaetes bacterium GWC1_27_15]OHD33899.1 MAG: UDP-N-acetylmuramoylalanine--D-glutamate ligase [Spirochaetes bacterium GWD1_27_9]